MLIVGSYFAGLASYAFFGSWAWGGLFIVAMGVYIHGRYKRETGPRP